MPDFGPGWVFAFHHLSILLFLPVLGASDALRSHRCFPPSDPLRSTFAEKVKSERFFFFVGGGNGSKDIFSRLFSLRIFCSSQATGPELCPNDDNT